MSLAEKETYFVAVKLFLEKDGQLFVCKDRFGHWDLPGGRIRKDEFGKPLTEVILRKVREELGDDVQCWIGRPVVLMRHERHEAEEPGNPLIRIFAVGYEAALKSGTIKLPPLFTEGKWVDVRTYRPEEDFEGGWLAGVQEYLALRRNS